MQNQLNIVLYVLDSYAFVLYSKKGTISPKYIYCVSLVCFTLLFKEKNIPFNVSLTFPSTMKHIPHHGYTKASGKSYKAKSILSFIIVFITASVLAVGHIYVKFIPFIMCVTK